MKKLLYTNGKLSLRETSLSYNVSIGEREKPKKHLCTCARAPVQIDSTTLLLVTLSSVASVASTCLISVNSQDKVIIKIPETEHPRKRFAVPVNPTNVPERIMPKGDAADASAPRTEFTLPSIPKGTIV